MPNTVLDIPHLRAFAYVVPDTKRPDLFLYPMPTSCQLPRKLCPELHLPREFITPQQGWEEASKPAPDLTKPVLLEYMRAGLGSGSG